MSIYHPNFPLIMYVALGTFLLAGVALLVLTITGTSTPTQYAGQLLVTVVWVSAFLALMAALGVIMSGGA